MKLPPFRIFQFILILFLGLYFFFPEHFVQEKGEAVATLIQPEPVVISGEIVEFPDLRKDRSKYIIGDLVDEQGNHVAGKIIIDTFQFVRIPMSARVSLQGVVEEPFETEEFSYKKYLSMYGVYGIMKNPTIFIKTEPRTWKRYLYELKTWFETGLSRALPDSQASLASGLITGSRRGIPDDLSEAITITGLTHIVAISGYNISLIIVFINGIFAFLPRTSRVVLLVVFITLFVIFVGAQASVVRAGIMGSIGAIALYMKRPMQITNLVLLTAILMALNNPYVLRDDIGFQLSFTATLGLIYLLPILTVLLAKLPDMKGLKEGLLVILSAQISVTPLIVYYFERFSLVSIPANIVVAPFIPMAMLLGTLVPLSVVLGSFASTFIALFAFGSLDIIISIAKSFAQIPHAQISCTLPIYWLVLYYVCLFIFVASLSKNKHFTRFPLFGRVEE
jgi:competence protein ComEC